MTDPCRRFLLLLLLLAASFLAGCLRGQVRIDVGWSVPADGVAFGEVFTLEVRRTWPNDAEPQPFDERALSPLAVMLVGTEDEPRGDGSMHEVRRYRARALAVGELQLPPVVFRVRDAGGGVIEAVGTPPPLRVRSLLSEPSGDMEWPDVEDLPRSGGRTWLLLLFALAGLGSVWWWRRPRVVPIAAHEPPPSLPSHELALARLDALVVPDATEAACEAFYTDLAAIVREHLGRGRTTAVPARTSEELVASASRGAVPLHQCLGACDLVKFAAHRPTTAAHHAALAAAREFVQATSPAGGGA